MGCDAPFDVSVSTCGEIRVYQWSLVEGTVQQPKCNKMRVDLTRLRLIVYLLLLYSCISIA